MKKENKFEQCRALCCTILLQDCVKLLTVTAGTLILSLETLQDTASPTAAANTLKDLGLTRLTVEQAVAVIQTRVDLEM